jgi:hypothetical protein
MKLFVRLAYATPIFVQPAVFSDVFKKSKMFHALPFASSFFANYGRSGSARRMNSWRVCHLRSDRNSACVQSLFSKIAVYYIKRITSLRVAEAA